MKIKNPWLIKIGVTMAVAASRILFWTCKKIPIACPEGVNPAENESENRFLFCLWHDHILVAVFAYPLKKMGGLVSRHRDGGVLVEAMKAVNIKPIRGSSASPKRPDLNRGGTAAMRVMLESAKEYDLAITPDGPQGPRREVKEGIVYLASRSGRPILPFSVRCSRYWRFQGSWTDLLVPKPFSKIYLIIGSHVNVPEDVPREELGKYCQLVQEAMEETERHLYEEVDAREHRQVIPPAASTQMPHAA